MNEKKPFVLPQRNPATHQAHRREVLWQILVPILLGCLVVIGITVLVSTGSAESVTRLGQISLVWLILFLFVFATIFLIVLAALIYASMYVMEYIPRYASLVQHAFIQVKGKAQSGSDMAVEPLIRLHTFWAGWRTLLHRK